MANNYFSDLGPNFRKTTLKFKPIPAYAYDGTLAGEYKAKKISKAEAAELYESMLVIREFEEMILKCRTGAYEIISDYEYRGPTHLSIGQEATAAGVCSELAITDLITSTHRGHGDSIAKGFHAIKHRSEEELHARCPEFAALSGEELREAVMEDHIFRTIAELFGKEAGYGKGRGGGMHIADFRVGHLGANAIVGGGIPIIRPISQCLAANDVTEIAGILNGTTNFILTKMIREQMNFEDALKLAQQLGYAERNPSADVEGLDACRKICILASLAFGTHVYPDSVYTEGITKITLQDVDFADVWGGVIKLIGSVKKLENGQVHIMVCPMFVHRGSQLASVDDVFNGIMVRGDATGDVVFYGKGAGKLPTASAVVADVIDCVKHFKARKYLFWEDAKPNYVADFGSMETSAFVRVSAKDSDTALNTAADVFGKITPLLAKRPVQGEAGFTVENLTEKELSDKLAALEARGVKVEGRIRISDY